ncbi:hypothetical protein [Mesorhizobium sp. 1B3]|uniref:hypothetical protein n=1 Tax=Mesorhizobium sp. 1B3 TaxID=3243599 RepID=UPI003D99C567
MTDCHPIAVPAARRWSAPAGAAIAMLLAAGCQSNQPAAGAMRLSEQTAPADLQLACAAAAATPLGVDSARILPVSSRQLDPQKYQVDLDASGNKATCVIDTAGTVLSVQKV